jgi:hypothetical protein
MDTTLLVDDERTRRGYGDCAPEYRRYTDQSLRAWKAPYAWLGCDGTARRYNNGKADMILGLLAKLV